MCWHKTHSKSSFLLFKKTYSKGHHQAERPMLYTSFPYFNSSIRYLIPTKTIFTCFFFFLLPPVFYSSLLTPVEAPKSRYILLIHFHFHLLTSYFLVDLTLLSPLLDPIHVQCVKRRLSNFWPFDPN